MRDEFDRILRFWFDRGVAGFRIDVAHMIVKDRELRDNPPATADDHVARAAARPASRCTTRTGPRCTTCSGAGGAIADEYDPPRLLVGETFVDRVEDVIPFYGDAATSSASRSTSRSSRRRSTLRRSRALVDDDRAAAARRLRAGVDGQQPRRLALRRPAGPAATRGRDAVRAADAADAARHAVPLLRRRARDARHRRAASTGCSTRSASSSPRSHGRDAARTPMPWTGAPGAGLHRRRASSRGCRSATSLRATSPTSATTRRRCCTSSATSSRCADALPELRDRRVRDRRVRRRALGLAARRGGRRRGQPRRRAGVARRCHGTIRDQHRPRAATARRSTGRYASTRGRRRRRPTSK